MTTPTEPREPASVRWAPIWTMAVRKAREVSRLTAEARDLRMDNAILRARLRLANDQRDRARDLAAALLGQSEWTERDVEFGVTNGIDVER